MAYLAPYYVHSKFSNFEENSESGTENFTFVSSLMNKLKSEIYQAIKTLESKERSFYNRIGIQGTDIDACFQSFLDAIKNNRTNVKEGSKEYIRQIIINTINNLEYEEQNRLFDKLTERVNKSAKNLSQITSADIKDIYIDEFTKILKRKLKNIKSNSNLEVIIKNILSSKYTFTEGKLTRRVARGAYGEIVEGGSIIDSITEIAEDNIIDAIQTGQVKSTRQGRKGQEISADYVIQYRDNDTGKLTQVGLQIKSYNLKSSGYSRVIKLGGFNTNNWSATKEQFSKANIMTPNQWNALTYALVNRIWFHKVGSYDITSDGSRAMVLTKKSTNPTELLEKVDTILRLLSVSNIIDGITTNGNSGGTVQLSKITNDTQEVSVNIPAVFWAVSSTYFFPTRWVLKGLLNNIEGDINSLFVATRTSTLQESKNLKLPTAWEFWKSKGEAVNWNFIHGEYSNTKLLDVGNTQGQAIANGLKVGQAINLYRKQLNAIINSGNNLISL